MLYIDLINTMIFTCQLKLFPFYVPVPDEKTSNDPASGSEGSRKLFASKPVLARPSNPVAPKLLAGNNPSSAESRGCKKES